MEYSMATIDSQLQDWLRMIRAEFEEMPDLQLTQTEAEKLWGLEPLLAEALLGALVSAGFLRLTRRGAYARDEFR
jgi:hypothetical protein